MTPEYYNIRCNVCGDSKKNTSRRRGYFLFNNHPVYMCHNCGISMSAEKWLREYFPNEFQSYIRDTISEKPVDLKRYEEEAKIKMEMEEAELKIQKLKFEQEQIIHFVNIEKGSGDIFKNAIEYCMKRKIPENVWKKFFVAVDGHYKDRLIIPFYDNKKKIYYYQARALKKQTPKYLNRLTEKDKAIYNFYGIDIKKPVIVLEGPLDSLFVENGIAVLGVKFSEHIKQKLEPLNCYYLFDSDNDGSMASKKLIRQRKYVFMWKWFLKAYNLELRDKWDMNEVCLALNKDKFTFEELKPYFSNNYMDGILI